jgi:osmotically-inducible protein OsmY
MKTESEINYVKTESEIQTVVMEELKKQAVINAIETTEIFVAVKNGVVILTGTVDTYSKRLALERAAMRVEGVKAVINDVYVKFRNSAKKPDTEVEEIISNVYL